MKTVVNYIITASLAIMFIFSSCGGNSTSSSKSSSAVYVLLDKTDSTTESNEELLSTTGLLELLKGKGEITFQEINGVNTNPTKTLKVSIPEGGLSGQTEWVINDSIKKFSKRLDAVKKQFLKPTSGAKQSSLYRPICEALQKLNKSKGRKTLIILSDMIENSQHGNFYRDKIDIGAIQHRLDSFNVKLQTKEKVKVIIIYNSHGNIKKDRDHDRAMQIWTELFKKSGTTWEKYANL
jgi:hypothetical protein